MLRDHVIAKLKDALPGLKRDYGVAELYLFGSVARGDDRPDSDVDVLVEFRPDADVSMTTLANIAIRLEDLLGRSVDVVENHPGLRPTFRERIEHDRLKVA